MLKTYLFLIGAILCEVAGTMLLPVSQNFTKLIPTTLLTIFYLTAFYLLKAGIVASPSADIPSRLTTLLIVIKKILTSSRND